MRFHPGFLARRRDNLYNQLVTAGLTTGLKVCLDFTSLDTYSGGQTLTDLSNNGDHFWKGSDGTSTLDPTFSGSVGGGTSSEYFTCNFAQLITQKTKGTWADAIHKDNATVTLMAVIKLASSSLNCHVMTNDVGRAAGPGFMFGVESGNIKYYVSANAAYSLQVNSTSLPLATGWNIIMLSYNEAGSSHFRLNNNTQVFTAAYTSPSTSAALKEIIFGDHDTSSSSFGVANAAIWSRNLSTTETGTLYTAIKDKWSL